MNKILCSVCTLTFNSGKTLERALRSVKDFDEIIINDGGSTDNTLEIAKKYDCKIISQDAKFKNPDGSLADFSGVRNQMIDVAENDWLLVVDSDEYLSKELIDYIQELDLAKKNILYNILRKYIIADKIIEHASTYPNYQIRLFNKSLGARYIKKVHEKLNYNNKYKIKKINKPFYVDIPKFKEFKRKGLKYLDIQLGMWKEIALKQWLRILIFHLRPSIGYSIRLFLIQFRKGNKLPFNYGLFQIYYNLVLIVRSIQKIRIK